MRDYLARFKMVFYLGTERKNTSVALASLDYANVLLIGEDSAFLRAGAMIKLVLDKGKVPFEISHDALDRSNSHFSWKLLSLTTADCESSNQQAEGPRRLRVKIYA